MSFLDKMMDDVKSRFEGRIDFVGQETTIRLASQILWGTGLVSFLAGFVLQSLRVTFYLFGAGLIACFVTIIPSYPEYNKHPVKWLPRVNEYGDLVEEELGATVTGSGDPQSHSKKHQ